MAKLAKITYKPGRGLPLESLAFISPAERKLLLKKTDGKSEMTKHGIRSYAEGGGTPVSSRDRDNGTRDSVGSNSNSTSNSNSSRDTGRDNGTRDSVGGNSGTRDTGGTTNSGSRDTGRDNGTRDSVGGNSGTRDTGGTKDTGGRGGYNDTGSHYSSGSSSTGGTKDTGGRGGYSDTGSHYNSSSISGSGGSNNLGGGSSSSDRLGSVTPQAGIGAMAEASGGVAQGALSKLTESLQSFFQGSQPQTPSLTGPHLVDRVSSLMPRYDAQQALNAVVSGDPYAPKDRFGYPAIGTAQTAYNNIDRVTKDILSNMGLVNANNPANYAGKEYALPKQFTERVNDIAKPRSLAMDVSPPNQQQYAYPGARVTPAASSGELYGPAIAPNNELASVDDMERYGPSKTYPGMGPQQVQTVAGQPAAPEEHWYNDGGIGEFLGGTNIGRIAKMAQQVATEGNANPISRAIGDKYHDSTIGGLLDRLPGNFTSSPSQGYSLHPGSGDGGNHSADRVDPLWQQLFPGIGGPGSPGSPLTPSITRHPRLPPPTIWPDYTQKWAMPWLT